MLKGKNKLKITELLLISFVWILLILAPTLFREEAISDWRELIVPTEVLIPLFIVFLINRFVLVPRLLFKKRNLIYIGAVSIIISILTIGIFFISDKQGQNRKHPIENNQRPLMPPPMGGGPQGMPPPGGRKPVQPPLPPFSNFLLFSFLMVGFDTGLMTTFMLAKSERKRAKLEKENSETQLAFLRNQVSPHFFMNTLNNIHSLIDIDTEEAKESIIRLSKLMRHLLYDSENETIPIQKEIDFFKNYVDLMKLRYSEKIKIDLRLPKSFPDKSIPPLLFTSFIENAFKHGISYQKPSFIDIEFICHDQSLEFKIKNSNFKRDTEDDSSGIGIENSRKRLELIYGQNYDLNIKENENEYFLQLNIPL